MIFDATEMYKSGLFIVSQPYDLYAWYYHGAEGSHLF